MKICNKCKNKKDLSEFNIDKSRKDGYSYSCKTCLKFISNKTYEKYEEEYKEKSKQYYEKNKKQHILKIIKVKILNTNKIISKSTRLKLGHIKENILNKNITMMSNSKLKLYYVADFLLL